MLMLSGCLVQEFLDRRKMTEFGSLALVDEGAGDGDGVQLSLPGVRKGERQAQGLNYQPCVVWVKITAHPVQIQYLMIVRERVNP